MPSPVIVPVSDASRIGEARRTAARSAVEAQLGEVDQGRVAIIATELATNLLKHAQGGRLVIQAVQTQSGRPTIELLSIDSGPGIADVDRALQDGFSTGGTAGNGLGAVRRLSDDFDVYSQQPGGTVLLSRVTGAVPIDIEIEVPQTNAYSTAYELVWSGIAVNAPGEEVCGDAWWVVATKVQLSVMVADGLGHGPLAAEASGKARDVFAANPQETAPVFLQQAHRALSGTRGAAVAIAKVDLTSGFLKYAGMGNICGTVLSGTESRGLFTHHGIVGVQLRKVQEFEYPLQHSGLLVMHSDGLTARWNIGDYPGLVQHHPGVIAGILLRDFVRGRDDATVVVARWNSLKANK